MSECDRIVVTNSNLMFMVEPDLRSRTTRSTLNIVLAKRLGQPQSPLPRSDRVEVSGRDEDPGPLMHARSEQSWARWIGPATHENHDFVMRLQRSVLQVAEISGDQ